MTVFLFVSGILDDKADILFRQISEALQGGHWNLSRCDESLALDFLDLVALYRMLKTT